MQDINVCIFRGLRLSKPSCFWFFIALWIPFTENAMLWMVLNFSLGNLKNKQRDVTILNESKCQLVSLLYLHLFYLKRNNEKSRIILQFWLNCSAFISDFTLQMNTVHECTFFSLTLVISKLRMIYFYLWYLSTWKISRHRLKT